MVELDDFDVTEIQNYNGVLPLLLIPYIDLKEYLDNLNEEDYKEFLKIEDEYRTNKNPPQFLEDNFEEWIKNNPKYKDIVKHW